jgi:hypothetical protein
MARAEEIERANPGLRISGNFLRGISVPDCIRNATALAAEILAEDIGGGACPAPPPTDPSDNRRSATY